MDEKNEVSDIMTLIEIILYHQCSQDPLNFSGRMDRFVQMHLFAGLP